jgi:MFS family permease
VSAARSLSKRASGLWKPPLRWLTLGLTLTVVATAFEALAVATVLPVTSEDLGGLAWYGWAFSAFMLANLVGISLGGCATDRGGPTAPFLWGTALFSGGLLISGLAPSMPVIVLGRCAQGLGAGLLSSVSYASIARVYATEQQPRMLATLSSAWVVPGLVGPGLASAIVHYASWRWVFLGLTPLPPLAALLVVPALRALPSQPSVPGPADRTSAPQLALGAGLALHGVGAQQLPLSLLLVPVGLLLAWRGFSRLMPAGTLRARAGLPAALACMGLLTAAFFGTEAFVPLALAQVRAQPLYLTGLALTNAAIFWTLGAWLPLRLTARMGRRRVVQLGVLVLMLGLLLTLSVLAARVPAWLIVIGWGVSGLGMGLAFTTTSAAILEAAPAGHEGATSASLQLAQVLGTALATGIGGALVAAPFAGDPPRRGIAAVDLLMLAVCLLALLVTRRLGARPAAQPSAIGTRASRPTP